MSDDIKDRSPLSRAYQSCRAASCCFRSRKKIVSGSVFFPLVFFCGKVFLFLLFVCVVEKNSPRFCFLDKSKFLPHSKSRRHVKKNDDK